MKKIASLIILIILLYNFTSTYAKDLPNIFWEYNNKYAQAVEQKDNYNIIEYGRKLVETVENEPQTDQVYEIMGSRLDQMGLAYERLGDYINAGICYERYIPYAELKGWDDGVKIAKAKILQYTPSADIYLASEEKTEKVLFGMNFDGETRKSLPNETMTLVYVEFGDTNYQWLIGTLIQAQRKGIAVEVALNMPNEGDQVKSVLDNERYIVGLLKVIEQYKDVNVFLRFAAEVNIWSKQANTDEYINAFRFVSNLTKANTTNTKMVWSVNQVSSWNINMNDYYPGDEYVDFVGVSSYGQKYFLGRNDWSEFESFNEIVFLTGESADPVKALTEIINLYGNRKPIIIAEGGTSHYVRTLNEDTTDWAVLNLKKMYHYVPMVYPQVKLMAYFDRSMPNEVNEYSLAKSDQLATTYKELTKLPHFEGKISYKKLDSTLTLKQKPQQIYSYLHIYKHQQLKANYYIDGTLISSSNEIPYNANIDFSKYPLGEHILKVSVEDNGSILHEKSYNINIIERSIEVTLNDKRLLFDINPITINDRTLVPMRAIFEAMGADVAWDSTSQTIVSKIGGISIKMKIGSNIMTKNNKDIPLDTAPTIFGSRTLIPVRAVSEALGAKVIWDEGIRTVKITK